MKYDFKYLDITEFTEMEIKDLINVITKFQQTHKPLTDNEQKGIDKL